MGADFFSPRYFDAAAAGGPLSEAKPVTGLGSGVRNRAVTGWPTKRFAKEGVGSTLGNRSGFAAITMEATPAAAPDLTRWL